MRLFFILLTWKYEDYFCFFTDVETCLCRCSSGDIRLLCRHEELPRDDDADAEDADDSSNEALDEGEI